MFTFTHLFIAFFLGWFASWFLWRPIVEMTIRLRKRYGNFSIIIRNNYVKVGK
jgi:hypothetical protein